MLLLILWVTQIFASHTSHDLIHRHDDDDDHHHHHRRLVAQISKHGTQALQAVGGALALGAVYHYFLKALKIVDDETRKDKYPKHMRSWD